MGDSSAMQGRWDRKSHAQVLNGRRRGFVRVAMLIFIPVCSLTEWTRFVSAEWLDRGVRPNSTFDASMISVGYVRQGLGQEPPLK